jgi:Ser/Thr protein kinase RdoA (MazF antagonist)
MPTGVVELEGVPATFWSFVELRPVNLDHALAAGAALRICHEDLARYPGRLPTRGPLEGALDDLAALDPAIVPAADLALLQRAATTIYRELAERALPPRPIHGDSTSRNVGLSPDGPVWFDWEEAFAGPVAWDLACLVTRGRALDEAPDLCEALLAGYGPDGAYRDAVNLLVDARVFETAVWRARHIPAQYQIEWSATDERLAWLRRRYE